jgi:hypothetical protein
MLFPPAAKEHVMTIGPAGRNWMLDPPASASARTPGYLQANAPGAVRIRPIHPAPVDKLTLHPVPAPVDRPEVPAIPVPRERLTVQPDPVSRGTEGIVAAPLPPPDAPAGSALTVPAGPVPRPRG